LSCRNNLKGIDDSAGLSGVVAAFIKIDQGLAMNTLIEDGENHRGERPNRSFFFFCLGIGGFGNHLQLPLKTLAVQPEKGQRQIITHRGKSTSNHAEVWRFGHHALVPRGDPKPAQRQHRQRLPWTIACFGHLAHRTGPIPSLGRSKYILTSTRWLPGFTGVRDGTHRPGRDRRC